MFALMTAFTGPIALDTGSLVSGEGIANLRRRICDLKMPLRAGS